MAPKIAADSEEYIPFSEIPRLSFLPRRRRGKKLHTSTVYRWSGRGLNGVRLRFTKCGGVRCTTITWLREFFDELAKQDDASEGQTDDVCRDPSDVEKELDSLGLREESNSRSGVESHTAPTAHR